MRFYLNKNCYLVNGAKNSAIYDLSNKKVYSVNSSARNFLEETLKKEIDDKNLENELIKTMLELKLLSTKSYKNKYKETKPKLKFTWLEITEGCNLNCVHCYGEFGHPKKSSNLLTLQDWKNIIDNLINVDCKEVQLIGGEPTMYKHFFEILKYCSDKGMKKITVFTNATLIDKQYIEKFKKYNVSVRVSIYGGSSNVHDKITGVTGSFKKSEDAIKNLLENNIPVSIAVVIMKENEIYEKEIKVYIESLGLKYNGYDVIRPGNIETKYKHAIKSYELLENVYQKTPKFYITEKSFFKNKIYNSCWNEKIAITATGDILPCVFARDNSCGNVKKDKIEDLKDKIDNMWKMPKDKIEICKDCEYRYACHDCRPLAIGVSGEITKKHPRCLYDPYTGIWNDIKTSKEIVKGG